jgi:hypothetical protein
MGNDARIHYKLIIGFEEFAAQVFLISRRTKSDKM